ncbi:Protein C8orf37 [Tetrabaena socialis]|uniref:Cilia- and flagella-associated protein 418 n=1 Tax=Tetrabaena socialis TaxID=47790 RepID=A0A2J7ZML8_9CHLO|nr:Protein C8orf37 [Tetrabaena socialis]|eukprot:PNH01511.1 Protein C8orf37 [Tetrabaena socialis]
MSLSVDDLLKEFDDLPGQGPASASQRQSRPAAAAAPHHGRSGSTPPAAAQHQPPRASEPASTSSQPHGRTRSVTGGKRDDLEALLSDLDFGGTPYNSMNGRNNPHANAAAQAATKLSGGGGTLSKSPSTISSKQKCTGVFVGGSGFPRGRMGAVGSLTCCDALRCTKCDFRVEHFQNRDWDDEVDYLFFRNNFPTEAKLAPKLRPRAGSVAYCCQCSWLSAVTETKLDFASETRWVCAGHLTA